MSESARRTRSDQLPDDLTTLDDIAAALITRLSPVRFEVARTERQRDDVFRLRCQAVLDRGWATPSDLPDGLERDADDDRAVLVGAWSGDTPLATARMIFPEPGCRLPVESIFGIDVEPSGRVVHVDRITVARSAGGGESRLLLGLIARCWLEMRARGFHLWTGIDSPGMLRLYRRLGFEMTVLGPSRTYWSEERFPVRFDPLTGIRTLQRLLSMLS